MSASDLGFNESDDEYGRPINRAKGGHPMDFRLRKKHLTCRIKNEDRFFFFAWTKQMTSVHQLLVKNRGHAIVDY